MIKLIALDLDGTLLNSESKISEKNIRALKKAHEQGIKIVLASGRPLFSLKKFIDELDIAQDDQYSISFNGAVVYNNGTGQSIYQKTIKGRDVKKAYALSDKLETNFFAYPLSQKIAYEVYSEYMMFEKNLVQGECEEVTFDDYDDDDEFIKMTFTDAPETLDAIMDDVSKAFSEELTVVRSHAVFIELLNKETSKGVALECLCSELGIRDDEVMAFGDNDNDYSMIAFAKYGIVMDNSSSKTLRSIASEIAPSNDDDGVAYIIDKYIR